jgi:hypothetical protein
MKKVFRVRPELNAQSTYQVKGVSYTFAAAPFDMPSYVALSRRDDRTLVAEFQYALGADEPTSSEQLAGGRVIALVGKISGRIMGLEIPADGYEARIAGAAEDLQIRERKVSEAASPDQPLRKAAHYRFVGGLLPEMNSYIAKELLPELRRITSH